MTCRYPKLLSKEHTKLFKEPLPEGAKFCATWRGGGFRDECIDFFESMRGKKYRVAGFLATSLKKINAMGFISRSNKDHPRILWCILVRHPDSSSVHLLSVWLVDITACHHRFMRAAMRTHRACPSCSSTHAVETKASSAASMRALCSKLKWRTRWNSSSRPTQCSR